MPERDRFLATVLFTDIVASTERASELGDRRWADLLQQHHLAFRGEIERCGGSEIGTAGDGFVATFPEPEAAVRCACLLRDLAHDLGLRIRCGMHAGEIQRMEEGIGGIAVHIASRVAARAEPDEVLVSSTVRDLVAGSGLRFADRGSHPLKGVEEQRRLFAVCSEAEAEAVRRGRSGMGIDGRRALAAGGMVLLALAGLFAWRSRPAADSPSAAAVAPESARASKASVAVLPFANASPDPDDEYFSDGLTEELISALSGIHGLRVPGRTSSFAFKDSAQDIRKIGRALGVAHVVEGSVRRSAGKLRIDARLVNTADGYSVWSRSYDRKLEDVLQLQAEIAREIAGALEVELSPRTAAGAGTPVRTADPVAYDHYLKGLYFSQSPTEEGVRRSIAEYQNAIRIDPEFAQAYAGLALAYHSLGARYGAGLRTYLPPAKTAAERALKLDDDLAESHLAVALVKTWWDRDYRGAERELQRALELSPSYAAAANAYGTFLMLQKRTDEGLALEREAVSLEPLSNVYAVDLGAHLYFARRYDQAMQQLRSTVERSPGDARAWLLLARAYEEVGRFDEAFAAYSRADPLPGHEGIKVLWRGHTLAVTGRRAAAEAMLARADSLARHQNLRQTNVAALELALGHRERALERLERAERERTLDPLPFQVDPWLDPLRPDPRFRRIVERMGLPQR